MDEGGYKVRGSTCFEQQVRSVGLSPVLTLTPPSTPPDDDDGREGCGWSCPVIEAWLL